MTREEFLASMDDLVELPAGTLKGPEKLEEVEGWNSMAMIGFIAMADQNGVKVAPRQIGASNTIEELLQLAKIEA